MRIPKGGRSPERQETDRILSLPVVEYPDAEEVEIQSFERLQAEAFEDGDRLFPSQVRALQAWERETGVLGILSVGSGKTGTALMICVDAIRRNIARRILYLLPVNLVQSLVRRHIPEWRRRVGLPVSFHHFTGQSATRRMALATSGAPGVYVLPYSLLSTRDTVGVLQAVDADLVIADEAHRLKYLRSAGPRRLFHWIRGRTPRPKLVAMSGSLTTKGIMEYHHLADAALTAGSPLPRTPSMAFQWSMVLDSKADPPPGMAKSVFGPLVAWAGTTGPDAARLAYQKRLTTVPGVAATGDERPSASLLIAASECPPPSERLLALMSQVADQYITPDGEPIAHAIHAWKWLRELSAGFYNSLLWPTPEQLAESRGISRDAAEELLDRARRHNEILKAYHKELRAYFETAPSGLDTPREVGRAISLGQIEGTVADLWHAVRIADFQGRPERLRVPVRVCDHKVRGAVAWAREARTGIVWAYNRDMIRWCWEALQEAGLDPLFAPAGAEGPLEAVGDPALGGQGDRLVVASLSAHGTGRNLQAFQRQLFVQWPRVAADAEQALGRLHRTGQRADEVVANILLSTEWDSLNRAACLQDAVYVQTTLGTPQRVVYADYDPLPKVYPEEFLRARGAQPKHLDPRARKVLSERFCT